MECAEPADHQGAGVAPPRRAGAGSTLYDVLVKAAAAACFGVIAGACVKRIAADLEAVRRAACDVHCVADIFSVAAMFAFYALLVLLVASRLAPKGKAAGVMPRFAAVAGSFLLFLLPLFPRRLELSTAEQLLSAGLMAVGMGLAAWTLVWLGRSFSIMPEARRLVTDGPYRLIRHPLYVAEFIASAGAVLQVASPWTILLWIVQVGYQLSRMHYEEGVLTGAFPEYRAYSAQTARVLPGIW
jgi:protein-S-isoprenylcysteine O-methyltransferase Ste14